MVEKSSNVFFFTKKKKRQWVEQCKMIAQQKRHTRACVPPLAKLLGNWSENVERALQVFVKLGLLLSVLRILQKR